MSQVLFFFGAGSNFAVTIIYEGKAELVLLPHERRKGDE